MPRRPWSKSNNGDIIREWDRDVGVFGPGVPAEHGECAGMQKGRRGCKKEGLRVGAVTAQLGTVADIEHEVSVFDARGCGA